MLNRRKAAHVTCASDKTRIKSQHVYISPSIQHPPSQIKPTSSLNMCVLLQITQHQADRGTTNSYGGLHTCCTQCTQFLSPSFVFSHHPPSFPHPFPSSTSPSSSHSVTPSSFISPFICHPLFPFKLFLPFFLFLIFHCHTLNPAPPGTLSSVTSHNTFEHGVSSFYIHSQLPPG